jgi:hypothetical protein
MNTLRRMLIATTLSVWAAWASGQWVWLDDAGHKVFSDLPPSSQVPVQRIFKRPGPQVTEASATPAPATAASAAKPASPAIDKVLEERKKKAEQAEADIRKVEEARVRQIKADNCQRARTAKTGLDSGARLSRFNAKGESEFLDDAARKAEAQRVQAIIDANCQ